LRATSLPDSRASPSTAAKAATGGQRDDDHRSHDGHEREAALAAQAAAEAADHCWHFAPFRGSVGSAVRKKTACWKVESRALAVVAFVGRAMKLTLTWTTRRLSRTLTGAVIGWLTDAGRLASKPKKRNSGTPATSPTGSSSVRVCVGSWEDDVA
jgi:hypothetical protein